MRMSVWSSYVCSSDPILVRARFLHRLAESGKPFWLLDIKVRIAERLLVPHDWRFRFFNGSGQQFVIPLILVAELRLLPWRWWRRARVLPGSRFPCVTSPAFRLPILIAASDDVHMATAIQTQSHRHRAIQKVPVMADDQHCAVIVGNHFLQQIEGFKVKVIGR